MALPELGEEEEEEEDFSDVSPGIHPGGFLREWEEQKVKVRKWGETRWGFCLVLCVLDEPEIIHVSNSYFSFSRILL